ncbi:MAG TPA: OmpA family protein [Archangium sp.]
MRPLPRLKTTILAAALATSGCVTQKQYDALDAERRGLEATLEDKNKALADFEKRQQRLTAQNQSLESQLASEQDKVKDLTARIDKLLSDMAAAAKDKNRLQNSVEEMTRALAELEKRRAEAEGRIAEFKSLLARFRSLIDAGKLKVKMVDGRMVVVLATDILFASGSASLSKDGKTAVVEVGQVLASIPKRSFQVEGHTDNVPIASAQYPSNWELASGRAINVLKAMVEAGMPPERVSAASFGDTRPVASNESKETKAQNRRIEIIIVPDLSQLPGFEELRALDKSQ